MALYQTSLTIPPNTPEGAPAEVILKPGVGNIRSIEILFPDGCLGLVGVKIMDENNPIAPLPSGWLRDNNKTIAWAENRRLQGPPYRLVIHGISYAIDWPHTIEVRMEITK